MPAKTRTIWLRIGERRYAITSDDDYLYARRPGYRSRLLGLLRAKTFEPRMVRLFSAFVRPGDTVLDVGANIGCTTLLFAQLAQRVIAFEPTPQTFRSWTTNVTASGHTNIVGMPYALGAEDKSSAVAFSDSNRSGAFVADRTSPGVGAQAVIEVKRLDSIVASLSVDAIDFIKIDVEGYEQRVIEGGWQTLERFRPVIQLELNSWCLNAQQRTSLPDYLDFILERFPLAYAVDRGEYVDLRTNAGRWVVMRENILEQRFQEMVVAFTADRLTRFFATYRPRPT